MTLRVAASAVPIEDDTDKQSRVETRVTVACRSLNIHIACLEGLGATHTRHALLAPQHENAWMQWPLASQHHTKTEQVGQFGARHVQDMPVAACMSLLEKQIIHRLAVSLP